VEALIPALSARRAVAAAAAVFTALRLHALRREVGRLQRGTLQYRTLACAWGGWCAYVAGGGCGTAGRAAASRVAMGRAVAAWRAGVHARARHRLLLFLASRGGAQAARARGLRRWAAWARRWAARRRLPPLLTPVSAMTAAAVAAAAEAITSRGCKTAGNAGGADVPIAGAATPSLAATRPSAPSPAVAIPPASLLSPALGLRSHLLAAGSLASRRRALSSAVQRWRVYTAGLQPAAWGMRAAVGSHSRTAGSAAWRAWQAFCSHRRRSRALGHAAEVASRRAALGVGWRALCCAGRPRHTAARVLMAGAMGEWRSSAAAVRAAGAQRAAAAVAVVAAQASMRWARLPLCPAVACCRRFADLSKAAAQAEQQAAAAVRRRRLLEAAAAWARHWHVSAGRSAAAARALAHSRARHLSRALPAWLSAAQSASGRRSAVAGAVAARGDAICRHVLSVWREWAAEAATIASALEPNAAVAAARVPNSRLGGAVSTWRARAGSSRYARGVAAAAAAWQTAVGLRRGLETLACHARTGHRNRQLCHAAAAAAVGWSGVARAFRAWRNTRGLKMAHTAAAGRRIRACLESSLDLWRYRAAVLATVAAMGRRSRALAGGACLDTWQLHTARRAMHEASALTLSARRGVALLSACLGRWRVVAREAALFSALSAHGSRCAAARACAQWRGAVWFAAASRSSCAAAERRSALGACTRWREAVRDAAWATRNLAAAAAVGRWVGHRDAMRQWVTVARVSKQAKGVQRRGALCQAMAQWRVAAAHSAATGVVAASWSRDRQSQRLAAAYAVWREGVRGGGARDGTSVDRLDGARRHHAACASRAALFGWACILRRTQAAKAARIAALHARCALAFASWAEAAAIGMAAAHAALAVRRALPVDPPRLRRALYHWGSQSRATGRARRAGAAARSRALASSLQNWHAQSAAERRRKHAERCVRLRPAALAVGLWRVRAPALGAVRERRERAASLFLNRRKRALSGAMDVWAAAVAQALLSIRIVGSAARVSGLRRIEGCMRAWQAQTAAARSVAGAVVEVARRVSRRELAGGFALWRSATVGRTVLSARAGARVLLLRHRRRRRCLRSALQLWVRRGGRGEGRGLGGAREPACGQLMRTPPRDVMRSRLLATFDAWHALAHRRSLLVPAAERLQLLRTNRGLSAWRAGVAAKREARGWRDSLDGTARAGGARARLRLRVRRAVQRWRDWATAAVGGGVGTPGDDAPRLPPLLSLTSPAPTTATPTAARVHAPPLSPMPELVSHPVSVSLPAAAQPQRPHTSFTSTLAGSASPAPASPVSRCALTPHASFAMRPKLSGRGDRSAAVSVFTPVSVAPSPMAAPAPATRSLEAAPTSPPHLAFMPSPPAPPSPVAAPTTPPSPAFSPANFLLLAATPGSIALAPMPSRASDALSRGLSRWRTHTAASRRAASAAATAVAAANGWRPPTLARALRVWAGACASRLLASILTHRAALHHSRCRCRAALAGAREAACRRRVLDFCFWLGSRSAGRRLFLALQCAADDTRLERERAARRADVWGQRRAVGALRRAAATARGTRESLDAAGLWAARAAGRRAIGAMVFTAAWAWRCEQACGALGASRRRRALSAWRHSPLFAHIAHATARTATALQLHSERSRRACRNALARWAARSSHLRGLALFVPGRSQWQHDTAAAFLKWRHTRARRGAAAAALSLARHRSCAAAVDAWQQWAAGRATARSVGAAAMSLSITRRLTRAVREWRCAAEAETVAFLNGRARAASLQRGVQRWRARGCWARRMEAASLGAGVRGLRDGISALALHRTRAAAHRRLLSLTIAASRRQGVPRAFALLIEQQRSGGAAAARRRRAVADEHARAGALQRSLRWLAVWCADQFDGQRRAGLAAALRHHSRQRAACDALLFVALHARAGRAAASARRLAHLRSAAIAFRLWQRRTPARLPEKACGPTTGGPALGSALVQSALAVWSNHALDRAAGARLLALAGALSHCALWARFRRGAAAARRPPSVIVAAMRGQRRRCEATVRAWAEWAGAAASAAAVPPPGGPGGARAAASNVAVARVTAGGIASCPGARMSVNAAAAAGAAGTRLRTGKGGASGSEATARWAAGDDTAGCDDSVPTTARLGTPSARQRNLEPPSRYTMITPGPARVPPPSAAPALGGGSGGELGGGSGTPIDPAVAPDDNSAIDTGGEDAHWRERVSMRALSAGFRAWAWRAAQAHAAGRRTAALRRMADALSRRLSRRRMAAAVDGLQQAARAAGFLRSADFDLATPATLPASRGRALGWDA
jgi:hypothetical protein